MGLARAHGGGPLLDETVVHLGAEHLHLGRRRRTIPLGHLDRCLPGLEEGAVGVGDDPAQA